jgi:hydrogenase maturation protease
MSAGGEALIIGIGNEYRGDDGAGLVVARALHALSLPHTRLMEHTGEAGALMGAWQNADYVFVIDAARASETPGAIFRFEAHDAPLPACFLSTSTHDLGVAEAIELSRLMGSLPERLVVYAIEGRDFAVGSALSLPVEHACREVVVCIVREVHAIASSASRPCNG